MHLHTGNAVQVQRCVGVMVNTTNRLLVGTSCGGGVDEDRGSEAFKGGPDLMRHTAGVRGQAAGEHCFSAHGKGVYQ